MNKSSIYIHISRGALISGGPTRNTKLQIVYANGKCIQDQLPGRNSGMYSYW